MNKKITNQVLIKFVKFVDKNSSNIGNLCIQRFKTLFNR